MSKLEQLGITDKVEKTDEMWRKELTPEQYHVLHEAGTERAFTGAYWDNHRKSVYHCAAGGLELFSSDTKEIIGLRLIARFNLRETEQLLRSSR